MQVNGGDERDDAFLAELVGLFVREAVTHVYAILGAVDAHARSRSAAGAGAGAGAATATAAAPLPARIVSEQAHAIKGSAANMGLGRLSAAAADVERPCRNVELRAASDAALDSLCARPPVLLRRLVAEMRAAVAFVESEVATGRVAGGAAEAFLASIPAGPRADVDAAHVAVFDEAVAGRFGALLGLDACAGSGGASGRESARRSGRTAAAEPATVPTGSPASPAVSAGGARLRNSAVPASASREAALTEADTQSPDATSAGVASVEEAGASGKSKCACH
jgi:HPt (histidine-containing phosphotransfer) domain-containing protein